MIDQKKKSGHFHTSATKMQYMNANKFVRSILSDGIPLSGVENMINSAESFFISPDDISLEKFLVPVHMVDTFFPLMPAHGAGIANDERHDLVEKGSENIRIETNPKKKQKLRKQRMVPKPMDFSYRFFGDTGECYFRWTLPRAHSCGKRCFMIWYRRYTMSHFVGKVFTEEYHEPYLRSAAFLFCGRQDWGGKSYLWENIKMKRDHVDVWKVKMEEEKENRKEKKEKGTGLSSFVWRLPSSSLEEYTKTDPKDRIIVVPDPDFVKGYFISGKITILKGEGEIHTNTKHKSGKRKHCGDEMSYVGKDLLCYEKLN